MLDVALASVQYKVFIRLDCKIVAYDVIPVRSSESSASHGEIDASQSGMSLHWFVAS